MGTLDMIKPPFYIKLFSITKYIVAYFAEEGNRLLKKKLKTSAQPTK
jgi:hypothetical protein